MVQPVSTASIPRNKNLIWVSKKIILYVYIGEIAAAEGRRTEAPQGREVRRTVLSS